MGQETWLDPTTNYQQDPHPLFPPGWVPVFGRSVDPHRQIRGRGLIILFRVAFLIKLSRAIGKPIEPVYVAHITNDAFEALAASLGPFFFVSLYVKHGPQDTPPEFLAEELTRLCPLDCPFIVVGGDFNCGTKPRLLNRYHENLHHYLDIQNRVPVKGPATHSRGHVLDYILTSSSPQLTHNDLNICPVPYSDHHLVTLQLRYLPLHPHLGEERAGGSSTNPIPLGSRPKLHFLRFLHNLLLRARRNGDPDPYDPIRLDVSLAFSQDSPYLTDIYQFNMALLQILVQHCGIHNPKPRVQRPYMYKRSIRQRCYTLIKAKSFYAKHPHTPGATEHLRALTKDWEKARRKAHRDSHQAIIKRIEDGQISIFWRMFQKYRQAKALTIDSTLRPPAVVAYFAALFSDPSAARIMHITMPGPSTHRLTVVTADEVLKAFKTMSNSAAGPDGLPPLMLLHCQDELAQPLAILFTQVFQSGLPPAMCEGLVTLIPKTNPPSEDPAEYRPITLLPAILRLMFRVLDLKIRRHVHSSTNPFPYEQGGFLPDRSTHLQTFLLLLMRDYARSTKPPKEQPLFVAFLDIEKAFDKIDHNELLDILRRSNVPAPLVDVVHRLLPHFRLIIKTAHILQQMGTFQGSPLSPLLCIIFLIDLIEFLKSPDAAGFAGAPLPWTHPTLPCLFKILLFADDVVLPAVSLEQLQLALTLVAIWARKRRLRFSPIKSFLLRLHRITADSTPTEQLPRLLLDNQPLVWKHEFPYLGHLVVESPRKYGRLASSIPLDVDKADKIIRALYAMFRPISRCQRTAPVAIRMGILQVLHAKFLYPTPVLDVDYEGLDVRTYRCLRVLLGQPTCTPTTLLAREMGVWNSRYLGHQRALRFLWHLRWSYWTRGIFAYWLAHEPSHQPSWLRPGWVHGGVMHRLHTILSTYGLSMAQLHATSDFTEWSHLVDDSIADQFQAQCNKSAARHNHPLLGLPLSRPPPSEREPNPPVGPYIAHYLRLNGDAACAGLRLRNTRLRLLPSYDRRDHGTCRYCALINGETGLHLLQCPRLPSPLMEKRAYILNDISLEIDGQRLIGAQPPSALVAQAISLDWPNMTEALCRRFCHFVRQLINAYANRHPHWEDRQLQHYPVRRVRPMAPRRKQTDQEMIDLSELKPLSDSL